MSSREISFWIDERWYDALSKRLQGETLEEHLEDVVDEMCNPSGSMSGSVERSGRRTSSAGKSKRPTDASLSSM